MNMMKSLTNAQIVAIYTKFEAKASKAELAREFNVSARTIGRAIEIAAELRVKAKAEKVKKEVKSPVLEEKILPRPRKRVIIKAAPRFKPTPVEKRVKRESRPFVPNPFNSAMADAFNRAMK